MRTEPLKRLSSTWGLRSRRTDRAFVPHGGHRRNRLARVHGKRVHRVWLLIQGASGADYVPTIAGVDLLISGVVKSTRGRYLRACDMGA